MKIQREKSRKQKLLMYIVKHYQSLSQNLKFISEAAAADGVVLSFYILRLMQ